MFFWIFLEFICFIEIYTVSLLVTPCLSCKRHKAGHLGDIILLLLKACKTTLSYNEHINEEQRKEEQSGTKK